MDRDRDESGRPRNARARDELGRPLPEGAAGVPRIPEDLQISPAETLAYAQDLLNQGPWQQAKIRSLPDSPPRSVKFDPTFRDLLKQAAAKMNQPRFKEEFRERPQVQTEFLTAVADSYQSLGEFETARALLQSTLALNLSLKPPDETTVILCRCRRAAANLRCLRSHGAVAEAVAILSAIERNIGSPTKYQVGVDQLDRLLEVVEEQIAEQPAISLDFIEKSDLILLALPLGRAKSSIDQILKVVDARLGPDDRRAQILRMFNAFAFEAVNQKDEAIAINTTAANSLENGPAKESILSWLPRLNLARLMSERGEFARAAMHY
jgi:tetratricopeptide (TPR) repeat protein